MKSGTTSLFRYLGEHPEIAPCSVDEPNFFSEPRHWEKGFDWYCDLWDWDPEHHAVALEASTNYAKGFKFDSVPERIADIAERGPEIHLIYIMRHPVDRVVSQYNHGVQNGWNELPDDPDSPFMRLEDQHLLDVSRYASQLDRYMEWFDRDDLHLLQLEALAESPERQLHRICQFLGISPDYDFETLQRNYNRTEQLEMTSPLWTAFKRQPMVNHILKHHLPGFMRSGLRRLLTIESRARTYEASPRQRERIVDALADDMRRLRDAYGVDVERWELELE